MKGTNNTNILLFWGYKLFDDFRLSRRVLENDPHEKRRDSLQEFL